VSIKFERSKEKLVKTAVLGMGNLLLKDEGIGIHLIHALKNLPGLESVDLIDGGTSLEAIDHVRDTDRLIVIDAAYGGEEPGSVYRITPEHVKNQNPYSIHELNVLQMLWTLNITGNSPKITIIGIEPKETDWGLELSPELEQRLPRITEFVLEIIKEGLEIGSFMENA
jgi:hydrogenase maturation protease